MSDGKLSLILYWTLIALRLRSFKFSQIIYLASVFGFFYNPTIYSNKNRERNTLPVYMKPTWLRGLWADFNVLEGGMWLHECVFCIVRYLCVPVCVCVCAYIYVYAATYGSACLIHCCCSSQAATTDWTDQRARTHVCVCDNVCVFFKGKSHVKNYHSECTQRTLYKMYWFKKYYSKVKHLKHICLVTYTLALQIRLVFCFCDLPSSFPCRRT